ncbi:DUF5777 family beta-barrel protein [Reichenbachiella sp. MALMAid0571]|uniref:DUF5777 family beta-barrel protein n=1 Tax=Reichenbachiella sp. MALMAid0571 TaxID=3143939 RepID=UPI0032DFD5BD
MIQPKYILIILSLFTTQTLFAQDDLLDMLEKEQEEVPEFATATFKGTRIINGHSIETRHKGTLDFIISHRFGELNRGWYELWGLDQSNIRLGLEYAPTENLYIGLARNSYEKTYDGFAKYLALKQKSEGGMPVSVAVFGSMALKTLRNPSQDLDFQDKLAFTAQLLIARKFNNRFSLQVTPGLIHYNLVKPIYTKNDCIAVGVGGRYKVTNRISVNVEYFYQAQAIGPATYNPIAIGVDIETGGHVFQLQLTNATAMIEKGFIGETENNFFNGDIHFGFNISRTFQLKKETK